MWCNYDFYGILELTSSDSRKWHRVASCSHVNLSKMYHFCARSLTPIKNEYFMIRLKCRLLAEKNIAQHQSFLQSFHRIGVHNLLEIIEAHTKTIEIRCRRWPNQLASDFNFFEAEKVKFNLNNSNLPVTVQLLNADSMALESDQQSRDCVTNKSRKLLDDFFFFS